jgi:hypothetical protein
MVQSVHMFSNSIESKKSITMIFWTMTKFVMSIEYHPLLNTETMFLGEENIQPTIDTSKISIQIEPYS